MPIAKVSNEEFIELLKTKGACETARQLKIPIANVGQRRRRIEKRFGIDLKSPGDTTGTKHPAPRGESRLEVDVQNGVVLIASDAHYWPGDENIMHKAFVRFCKDLKPKVVILNGDVMDFPGISRHARIGWEHRPDVQAEIEWAQDKTDEIVKATRNAVKIWTLGNHDARFESRLAAVAPEFAKVHGVHLKDHFPLWEPCWSVWINGAVVVKHRFRGGIHAVHNNILWSGKSVITGHLHSAKVLPFTDYNGTRWGVDTGCLADPDAQAFLDYTEDNPKNWRSAFAVLTFKNGILLQPELVLKWNIANVQFRGEIITL